MRKAKITEGKISDLQFDDKNFNKGTQYGDAMLEKSLSKYGAGRSILVDKNNNIIAGNKTAGKAGEMGMENALIIESDGTQLIVVKRTDIDLDSDEGRGLAFADNFVSKVNLEWDYEAIAGGVDSETIKDFGFSFDFDFGEDDEKDYSDKNKEIDVDGLDEKMKIVLEYTMEEYELVKRELSKHGQSPEAAIWNLLNLNI